MTLQTTPTGAPFDPFSIESRVRSYCRRMPAVFSRAINAEVWDETGRRYIDFLSACGSLNYGHNHPEMKSRLIDYISGDGISTSMDLHTRAKREFLGELFSKILAPRRFPYVVQFPGPTGTNAVEAALKLARKITRRRTVVAFSNAFHGMTLGALAATGSRHARGGAGVPLEHIVRLPFDSDDGANLDELTAYLEGVRNPSSGFDAPAAFIVETIQGEGGLNVASAAWLRRLSEVANELGALLIVDDIQAGCGRTGTFFSFERAQITPDIVCLAKSISGYGLPMALVLIKPEYDQWLPAEHNGTFRGNNHAFVTGKVALGIWSDPVFQERLDARSAQLDAWLDHIQDAFPARVRKVGLGLMGGLKFAEPEAANSVAGGAVKNGVMIELCGSRSEVLKIMPPLTIETNILREGLDRLEAALLACLSRNEIAWEARS